MPKKLLLIGLCNQKSLDWRTAFEFSPPHGAALGNHGNPNPSKCLVEA